MTNQRTNTQLATPTTTTWWFKEPYGSIEHEQKTPKYEHTHNTRSEHNHYNIGSEVSAGMCFLWAGVLITHLIFLNTTNLSWSLISQISAAGWRGGLGVCFNGFQKWSNATSPMQI
jgi:hypothetical protein